MRKKGQFSNLFIGGVATVVAFGVFVIALSLIGQVLDVNQTSQSNTLGGSKINESVAVDANVTLSFADTVNFGSPIDNTSVLVTNRSGTTTAVLVNTADYIVFADGTFNVTDSGTTGIVNVSYNYSSFEKTTAYNVSGKGLTGTANVGDLASTMGLVVGVLLVLALLVGLLAFFGTRRF